MFWKRAEEEDDNNDDIREGMEVMPAIIGILLVLLAGFQLFYRYDSWPSKTREDVMYERDRLTGELHVIYPGDKVSMIDRVTGHYGHKADEVAEDGQTPLVVDAHQQAPIPEPQDSRLSSQGYDQSQQYANNNSQPYYSQPYPQQQPPQGYYQQPQNQQQQPQAVAYPVPQPVIVTIPASAFHQPQAETRQPEYRTQEYRAPQAAIQQQTQVRQSIPQNPPAPVQAKVIPTQAITATQTTFTTKQPLAVPAKVVAKATNQPSPRNSQPAYQMSMVAGSDMQLRTEHQPVMVPFPGAAPSNPKPSFQPLVPQTAQKPQAVPAVKRVAVATPPSKGTTSQSMDLNRDGSEEHIIQTPRADGHINISVVSEGKEILFGHGQQLQVLPTRRQGWADLAVMNTRSGQRQVYQFDSRTQAYTKAYVEPLRPVVAQSAQ